MTAVAGGTPRLFQKSRHRRSAILFGIFGRRNHFSGIEDIVGIKCTFEGTLGSKIIFGKNHAHGFLFLETDAVLAGYGSAQLNAGLHDFPTGFFNPLQLVAVTRIKQ